MYNNCIKYKIFNISYSLQQLLSLSNNIKKTTYKYEILLWSLDNDRFVLYLYVIMYFFKCTLNLGDIVEDAQYVPSINFLYFIYLFIIAKSDIIKLLQ